MSGFELGVNYWPARSAMFMWERFDLGEIREDLAHIHALGLQVVRFFIMWDDFQPQPDRMEPAMLRKFDAMLDAIADANLRAMPTFFTGHMSGVNYLPEWSLDPARPHGRFRTFGAGLREYPYGAGDFYSGPLLEAGRRHVRAVGERAREHPAICLWDLGNEFSNLRSAANPAESAHWSKQLCADLLEVSGIGCTAGTHGEDITDDRGIRASSFCAPLECPAMHGYSVYSDFARSRTDPMVVPFLCRLWQSMAGKPVLFNEFGNPTCPPGTVSPYDREPLPGDPPAAARDLPKNAAPYACLTEEEMAAYCTAVLERLHRFGALGAYWWNSCDYVADLAQTPPFDRAQHELHFGIFRSDGSEKPVALALKNFARQRREVVPPPPPMIDEGEWYAQLSKDEVKRRYAAFLETNGEG